MSTIIPIPDQLTPEQRTWVQAAIYRLVWERRETLVGAGTVDMPVKHYADRSVFADNFDKSWVTRDLVIAKARELKTAADATQTAAVNELRSKAAAIAQVSNTGTLEELRTSVQAVADNLEAQIDAAAENPALITAQNAVATLQKMARLDALRRLLLTQ